MLARASPASLSGRASRSSRNPLVVIDSSTPSRATAATTSTRSRRSVGSPPVMRIVRTPRSTATRRARINSSRVSTLPAPSHGSPSSGMQYRQRKLQRSVTETRRSRTTRPKVSTIRRSATADPLQAGGADPAVAVGPALLLPDRDGALQLVDQLAAAGKRLGPVGRGRGHDHARLGLGHHAGPVGEVHRAQVVAVGRLPGHPLHDRPSQLLVGLVLELLHHPALARAAGGADEQGRATAGG